MRLQHPLRAAAVPSTSARASRVCHVHLAPRNGARSCPSPPMLLLPFSSTAALGRKTGRGAVVARAGTVNAATDAITKALEMLEAERDEASKTAESCAKTCVRLAEMVKLLDDLALEKVKAGDEAGAKAVLEEKKSIRDVLDKTSVRAQSNYALAAKLAQKIGEKQNELLAAMRSIAGAPSSFSSGAGNRSSSSSSSGMAYGGSTSYGTAGGGGSASSSTGASQQYAGSGYNPRPTARPQWQSSLEESLKRVKEQESDAQVAGRYARQSAEESVAAAKARLAARMGEDILSAAQRVRRNPDESLAQAQQRLRQRDAELLAYCQRIVARFRRGEWVDDDELEFAFRMLEKRMA